MGTLKLKRMSGKDWEGQDTLQEGIILARVAKGAQSIGNMSKGKAVWNTRYYALGRPVWTQEDGDTFQLFASKAAYQECVATVYENKSRPANDQKGFPHQIESLNLENAYKLSKIKCKSYRAHGTLYYFALEVPSLRFVAAKFASESRQEVEQLHRGLRKAIDKKKWAPRGGPLREGRN